MSDTGVWVNGVRVDDASAVVSYARRPVLASVGPIANLLACPTAQDGGTLAAGQLFFVKDGASPDGIALVSNAYNGLYAVGTVAGGVTTLTRAYHAQLPEQLAGLIVFVETGTVNGGTAWCLPMAAAGIVVNTTPLIFVPSGAGAAGSSGYKAYVRAASIVPIPDLSVTNLAAAFGAVYAAVAAAGDRVLVHQEAHPTGGVVSHAFDGIYTVGVIALGVAPLIRSVDADTAAKLMPGSTCYVELAPFDRRVFYLEHVMPFTLDVDLQEWWLAPSTTLFGSWAFFSTGALLDPEYYYEDQLYYVTTAGQHSLWQCVRILTDTWKWQVQWSAWYGTFAGLPVAAEIYVGLRYYATDHGLWYTCVQTGAATYEWRPGSPGNLYLTWAQFALVPATSVLHGLHAYITDGLAEYRCVRTAAGTFIWQLETYDARSPTDANDRLVYLLDETAGPILDNSGAEAAGDLTAYGAPGFGRVGLFDGALDIPGDRSGAQGATTNTYSYATPTISLWVYPRRMDEDAYVLYRAYLLAGTWVPGAINTAVHVLIKIGGGVEFSIYGGAARRTAAISAASPHALGLREWQQIVCTFDANTLRLYTRGNEAATAAYVGAIDYNTHGPWVLGSVADAGGGPAPFDGLIDRVRIANTVRSAAWVRETTQRGLGTWGGP